MKVAYQKLTLFVIYSPLVLLRGYSWFNMTITAA
jgi:hypothetical protein